MVEHRRGIAVIGAASSIGIRPYDDGRQRQLDLAPGVLRTLGLVERLRARDFGDVTPPPYRDFVRPERGVRNELEVQEYSRRLAELVDSAVRDGGFPLVLGGDCSVVLGSLLGVAGGGRRVGLAYLDAHADFGTPAESVTGSAASMCLAAAIGRGDTPLARLGGSAPLVRAGDVALVGRRDADQPYYGHEALAVSGILDLTGPEVYEGGSDATAARILDRVARSGVDGFWIHVDADALDPAVMPAVDSPEPGGFTADGLAALVAPLARHPKALGMHVTIYDPALDPDRSAGGALACVIEMALESRGGR